MGNTGISAWRRLWVLLAAAAVWALCLFSCEAGRAEDQEDSPYAVLSLYAYGDATINPSGSLGHTFLTIKNPQEETITFCGYPIAPQRTISVSIWGDVMGLGGVYINREMAGGRSSVGAYCASLSADISESTFREIERMTPGESYYHDGNTEGASLSELHDNLWHNCTTYSVMVWNKAMALELDLHTASTAPPEPHDSRWTGWNVDDRGVRYHLISESFLGIDAPKWVKEEIQRQGGHREGSFSHEEPWSASDVFYLAKDGSLLPDVPPAPAITSNLPEGDSISLSWECAGLERPEMQKCDLSYEILCLTREKYAEYAEARAILNGEGLGELSLADALNSLSEFFSVEMPRVPKRACTLRGLAEDRYVLLVRTVCKSWDGAFTTRSAWSGPAEVSIAPSAPVSELGEEDLRAIARQHGTVGLWGWADYDGDGAREAFAILVRDWNDIESVWFINSRGEASCMAGDIVGACYAMDMGEDAQCVLDCGGQKVFWADYGAYGSGWQTLLFSVRDAAPYELELSRDIQGIAREEVGYSTTENDFSSGAHQYLSVPLSFDQASGEFVRN